MSKLVQIALILLTFTAQSVMAVSVHCSMDMNSMDMSSVINPDMVAQTDMHVAMGHHNMDSHDVNNHAIEGSLDNSKQSMDCCDSIYECPTGTCSVTALSEAFIDVISIVSKSTVSTEYRRQIQTSQSNLFRPPILA